MSQNERSKITCINSKNGKTWVVVPPGCICVSIYLQSFIGKFRQGGYTKTRKRYRRAIFGAETSSHDFFIILGISFFPLSFPDSMYSKHTKACTASTPKHKTHNNMGRKVHRRGARLSILLVDGKRWKRDRQIYHVMNMSCIIWSIHGKNTHSLKSESKDAAKKAPMLLWES